MNFEKPIILGFDRLIMRQFNADHQFVLIDFDGKILQSNNTLFDLSDFIDASIEDVFPLLGDYFQLIKSNPKIPLEINCIAFTFQEKEATYDIKLYHVIDLVGNLYLVQFYDRSEHYERIRTKHQKKIEDFLDNQVIVKQSELIQKQNDEIKTLIKEAHHRIKNNLQVINSLIDAQVSESKDAKLNQILKEVQNRIHSMALLHEYLYRSQSLKNVNVQIYIESLVNDLIKSYAIRKVIDHKVATNDISLNSRTLVVLGLLINELISNSLKHGFKGVDKCEIMVELETLKKDRYRLKISDNGIGIPKDILTKKTDTLGMELIQTFTQQLNGEISLLDGKGANFQIDFSEIE